MADDDALPGQLVIGPASGQTGLYTLSGAAATLNVTGDFIVGVTPGGSATYTQTAGQASVGSGTNGLMVGTGGGSGTVNLQGGSLTTFNAFIGRTAEAGTCSAPGHAVDAHRGGDDPRAADAPPR